MLFFIVCKERIIGSIFISRSRVSKFVFSQRYQFVAKEWDLDGADRGRFALEDDLAFAHKPKVAPTSEVDIPTVMRRLYLSNRYHKSSKLAIGIIL